MNQLTPMQLISMIKNGSNPQQLLMSIMENGMSKNPIMQNVYQLMKNQNYKGIQQVARNLAEQRGIDFDKEFEAFKNNLGLK